MNIKGFFVTALSSALDLGMATSEDVIRHVTPDILAAHLPRPLWARLLTACVGAPKVDAQLVVETIGIPNLCEHVPSTIMWECLKEIGARSLGGAYVPTAVTTTPLIATPSITTTSTARPIVPLSMTPPPEVNLPPTATQPSPTVAMGPDIPAPSGGLAAELFGDLSPEDRPTGPGTMRSRSPTSQRFRQSSTGIGRLAAGSRRPQASASASPPEADSGSRRRSSTESDYDVVTDVNSKNDDWKASLAVEDEQLVDWSASEETVLGGNTDTDPPSRKR